MVQDLNRIYCQYPELAWGDVSADGFRWINGQDYNSNLIAFIRMDAKQQNPLIVIGHFSGIQRTGYRIGVPADGAWNLVFSSVEIHYGGSGMGGVQSYAAQSIPWDGYSHSIVCDLPAHAVLFLKQG